MSEAKVTLAGARSTRSELTCLMSQGWTLPSMRRPTGQQDAGGIERCNGLTSRVDQNGNWTHRWSSKNEAAAKDALPSSVGTVLSPSRKASEESAPSFCSSPAGVDSNCNFLPNNQRFTRKRGPAPDGLSQPGRLDYQGRVVQPHSNPKSVCFVFKLTLSFTGTQQR